MLYAVILTILHALSPEARPCGPEMGETCQGYAAELAGVLEGVEVVTGVDSELLLAIALAETQGTLRRDRHGRLGRGLFGLNPRSPQYAYAVIGCDLRPDRCLEVQASMAAGYLRYERNRCRGITGALHSYGTGRCDGGEGGRRYEAYVRRWLRVVKRGGES